MLIVKHFITFVGMAILLVACNKTSPDKENAQMSVKKTIVEKKIVKISVKPLPLSLPHMLPAKGVLQHTMYVGTTDHPTIDGGIINAADGIPVNNDVPVSILTNLQTAKVSIVNDSVFHQSITTKAFQDNWATSQKVKILLEEAARNGKLDYVLKKTDEMGLPASVATVPMVESHYQDSAISPKGAAGAWQLMPVIANDYGIKKDQRFQFETSTNTALELLNSLHKQFGSWALAFAAYNAGATRVQRALQKNPNATSVEQLDLPIETKNYVNHIMSLNKALSTY